MGIEMDISTSVVPLGTRGYWSITDFEWEVLGNGPEDVVANNPYELEWGIASSVEDLCDTADEIMGDYHTHIWGGCQLADIVSFMSLPYKNKNPGNYGLYTRHTVTRCDHVADGQALKYW